MYTNALSNDLCEFWHYSEEFEIHFPYIDIEKHYGFLYNMGDIYSPESLSYMFEAASFSSSWDTWDGFTDSCNPLIEDNYVENGNQFGVEYDDSVNYKPDDGTKYDSGPNEGKRMYDGWLASHTYL